MCREVGSILKLRKHLAEESQGTTHQILCFLGKSALLWRSQVCTEASFSSLIDMLLLFFLLFFFHRQARQVPLSIADFEAVAFCASFSKECNKSTWAVTSDEKVGNVSFYSSHHGHGKNLADKVFHLSQAKVHFPHTLRVEIEVFGPFSSEPERAACCCFSRNNSARKESLQITF